MDGAVVPEAGDRTTFPPAREPSPGLMKAGRKSRILAWADSWKRLGHRAQARAFIRIRKAGKQEQPQEQRLALVRALSWRSSVETVLPRGLVRCEQAITEWMSSRILIALRSTTMLSDTLGQGFMFQGHLFSFLHSWVPYLTL